MAAMCSADPLLIDGTLWTDDEMIRLGLSSNTGADMGHRAQTGTGGMIEVLDTIVRRNVRKVLVHINNTNPILRERGPERAELERHGIEVAHDGMQFEL
ncbi:pyrroloquinoline quinone biosynthesis protein PqqB [Caballeronia catudaia]|uniref:Pyrroloquinoline quinone biosynthesis protein PqqB n=1 Tax=Caballeronia catudaia TaxID=1777136 RepID=A0A158DS40_9BURK|nr:pyrroloquinoline quinone biosynthesis protein PqqB [Caballeronia catudaia]